MPSLNPSLDRRAVLRLIAAGATAAMTGCSRPDEAIYPYVDQPEGMLPGVVRRYATALPLAGYGRGITGLVVDGRPIKLEGLADHPASLGATDLFTECAILDLYDPQRLRAPQNPIGPASWDAVATAIFERVGPRRGQGLALLTGRITSPTLLARIEALGTALPGLRHVRWEPLDDDGSRAGTAQAFGRPLTARPRLTDADVVLCLGADPFGPGPDQVAFARSWSARRRLGPPSRLFVIDSSPTATGAMANRRAAASPGEMARVCHALASGLGGAAMVPTLSPEVARVVDEATRALLAARGRALVLAGDGQPAALHAFAAWANGMLGAPLDWIEPVDPNPTPHAAGLTALAAEMHGGVTDTLVVIDANPVYAAPPALGFGEAMARVPLTIAATAFANETSARARWRLPLAHPLEDWHDWRATDGTLSIAQPLVRPFYDTRTAIELVDLVGDPAGGPGNYRRARERWPDLGEEGWRAAVASALVPNSKAAPVSVRTAPFVVPPIPADAPLIIEIRPSPALFDGRFSTNAWAQECPDPLTKEVWGASARLHADDMAGLGLVDGDLVRVGAIIVSARAMPGQARGVATLLAGYGRSSSGAVADGIGANAFICAGTPTPQLAAAGGHAPVTTTQHVFELEGELARLFPTLAPGGEIPAVAPRPSLLPNPPPGDAPAPQWGMAIDTDICIGCNACVVACQAENNIPAIGPEEMARGRDMHWLRVDRYELAEDGRAGFQPVPCMQCEAAPCEPVCPVEASVHDHQGLNVQVYNRCIGTRTCQANCPYKVRRFNFFDYAGRSIWGDADAAPASAQRNPDVTVRARGVMEKCTYCVQRISAANRDAAANGGPVGEVVTACQAACPTRAISFGDITAPDSVVSRAKSGPRHYALLAELGTRPRTTYLARVIDDEGAT